MVHPVSPNVNHTFTGVAGALTTYPNWSAGLLGDHYSTGTTSLSSPSLVITAANGTDLTIPGIAFHSSEATTAGYRPGITFDAVAIPEPATVAFLTAAAALGLALVGRRTRRTTARRDLSSQ